MNDSLGRLVVGVPRSKVFHQTFLNIRFFFVFRQPDNKNSVMVVLKLNLMGFL